MQERKARGQRRHNLCLTKFIDVEGQPYPEILGVAGFEKAKMEQGSGRGKGGRFRVVSSATVFYSAYFNLLALFFLAIEMGF